MNIYLTVIRMTDIASELPDLFVSSLFPYTVYLQAFTYKKFENERENIFLNLIVFL